MEGTVSPSLLNLLEENACEKEQAEEEEEEGQRMARKILENESDNGQMEDTAEQVRCMVLNKRGSSRKGEEPSRGKHAWWRQEPKTRAARLEKQLQARWKFEELIEEQLNRFLGHYNGTTVPTRLKDVSDLLMPEQVPPHELATLTWIGDWRPSAILEFVHDLACCLPSSFSSRLSGSNDIEHILSQLIHDIRIEETIIDAEMAEIQSTCVFYLPFAPANSHRSCTDGLESIQAEFKKIKGVIGKAQQLRYKALELVVKKVLNQTGAAEFLVAFAGIQDAIHQSALRLKLKDPVAGPSLPSDQVKLQPF